MFKLSGIVSRTSAAAESIQVDVLSGTCVVTFKDGSRYGYTDVSRRALFTLLNNETMSLGFFIRDHLLFCDSKQQMYGIEYKLA